MKRVIDVWQKQHPVEVRQHAKNEWIAVGYYSGRLLEARGETELKAANKWRRAAISYEP